MNEPNNTSSGQKCPRCGAVLPRNTPADLCPKCLLHAGLAAQPSAGPTGTVVLPETKASSRGLPQPGEQLGHYSIVRLIGAGGMGAVYEAEDLENGRRVALKVLSHTLDSPEARERFFREGRLAASINHPNSVYIFGTEEIGGTPVIAMELVSGGTLQDRIKASGPMPVSAAVDAVLQIIAGLEAAQRIGILHRDVKPSNCFVDADGMVKIGDFGLSISTNIRTDAALTATGVFLGTPAFCSPEQLRGDELNARSDMYSVGATLFYLLTGRTPFEGKTVVQLLATVLDKQAPSPRQFRAAIPRRLAAVVLRCLEKQAGERFKTYEDLAEALTPYSSTAPTPATLGLRLAAGFIDMALLGMVGVLLFLPEWDDPNPFLDLLAQGSMPAMLIAFGALSWAVLYYALFEAFRGATLGKAICRLRVVRADAAGGQPGFGRALVRAIFYTVLPATPYWMLFLISSPRALLTSSEWAQFGMNFVFYGIIALLFSTARRRNGFAAIHDLVTGTRVVSRVALQSRPALSAVETAPPPAESAATIGPYHVLRSLEKSGSIEWLLAYDLRLLRKVWVRTVPAGTPPMPMPLRNLARPGRLRWLTGRRSPEENWDAFEALSGRPLLQLAETPQSWAQVRFWLFDLANEIHASAADGTSPVLALDRIWVTGDGRAKLLDFRAPGLGVASGTSNDATSNAPVVAAQLLHQLAAIALQGNARSAEGADVAAGKPKELTVRLPLHARDFLQKLPQFDSQAVLGVLKPLLHRPAEVSRVRRALIVAACVALPIFASVACVGGIKMMQKWNHRNPGMMALSQTLQVRSSLNSRLTRNKPHPSDAQFAIHIASHYRTIITNGASWSNAVTMMMIKGDARRFAEQSVVDYPSPTAKEVAEADAAMKAFLPESDVFEPGKDPPWLPVAIVIGILVAYVAIPALIAALLFRGGLVLLATGVTFVRRDGRRASRLRLLWRAMVAWSVVIPPIIVFATLYHPLGIMPAVFVAVFAAAVPVAVSVALPARGIPERLSGTWPVPR